MKLNMGKIDRIIRIAIAAVLVALFFARTVTGWLGVILLVIAGIFLLTSLVGICPLYSACHIRTNRTGKEVS